MVREVSQLCLNRPQKLCNFLGKTFLPFVFHICDLGMSRTLYNPEVIKAVDCLGLAGALSNRANVNTDRQQPDKGRNRQTNAQTQRERKHGNKLTVSRRCGQLLHGYENTTRECLLLQSSLLKQVMLTPWGHCDCRMARVQAHLQKICESFLHHMRCASPTFITYKPLLTQKLPLPAATDAPDGVICRQTCSGQDGQ